MQVNSYPYAFLLPSGSALIIAVKSTYHVRECTLTCRDALCTNIGPMDSYPVSTSSVSIMLQWPTPSYIACRQLDGCSFFCRRWSNQRQCHWVRVQDKSKCEECLVPRLSESEPLMLHRHLYFRSSLQTRHTMHMQAASNPAYSRELSTVQQCGPAAPASTRLCHKSKI